MNKTMTKRQDTRDKQIQRSKFKAQNGSFWSLKLSIIGHCLLLVSCLLVILRSSPLSAQTTNPSLPALWLVGDSTVRNGSGNGGNGQWGWGDRIARYFDSSRINVVNRARGGRSSRTFITEGLWDGVLKDCKPGDFVMIQMGHNDGGALAGDNRERGSIRGTGEETEEVTLTLKPNTGKKETVHTYGWYLRKYISDARAKGMTPIICSPIPRRPKATVKPGETQNSSSVAWSEEVAKATNTFFIPLNTLILAKYAGISPDELKQRYFTKADDTHTNADGADLNAACVVEGIRALKDCPLSSFLREAPLPLPTTKR
jgi:rhamnogalacturonan acetylesterase